MIGILPKNIDSREANDDPRIQTEDSKHFLPQARTCLDLFKKLKKDRAREIREDFDKENYDALHQKYEDERIEEMNVLEVEREMFDAGFDMENPNTFGGLPRKDGTPTKKQRTTTEKKDPLKFFLASTLPKGDPQSEQRANYADSIQEASSSPSC